MIVNVSSGAGKMSIPFLAGYVASKHALEGLSNSLRRELLPWQIPVVVVGPGNVKTPIWDKAGDDGAYDATVFGPVYPQVHRVHAHRRTKGMEAHQIAAVLLQSPRRQESKDAVRAHGPEVLELDASAIAARQDPRSHAVQGLRYEGHRPADRRSLAPRRRRGDELFPPRRAQVSC